jgi:hypothetical protein
LQVCYEREKKGKNYNQAKVEVEVKKALDVA